MARVLERRRPLLGSPWHQSERAVGKLSGVVRVLADRSCVALIPFLRYAQRVGAFKLQGDPMRFSHVAAALAVTATVSAVVNGPLYVARVDAANMTTGQLRDYCRSRSEENRTTCLVYINGVMDMFFVFSKLRPDVARGECISANVDYGAIARIFVKWSEKNPEKHRFSASSGLLESLADAFPCLRV